MWRQHNRPIKNVSSRPSEYMETYGCDKHYFFYSHVKERPAVRHLFHLGGQNGQQVSVNWDKLRVSTLKALANDALGQTALMETCQRSRMTVDAHKHGVTRAQSAACACSAPLIFSVKWQASFVYICNSALQWSQLVWISFFLFSFLFLPPIIYLGSLLLCHF